MQKDIDTVSTAHAIRISGVNEAGQESGNDAICVGRTLPWLQDIPLADHSAWQLWHVTFRDVVVLDPDNAIVQVYNLTSHDLTNPANYAQLRQILVGAAGPPAAALAGPR